MTHSGTLIRICIDSYLTLIYNSLELILYLSVKNFTKVFCSETCWIRSLALEKKREKVCEKE